MQQPRTVIPASWVQIAIADKLESSAGVGLLHPISGHPSMNNYFYAWLWVEQSFAGAILCVITLILILFTFNNNEWVTVLSAHPQISPPW